MTTTSHALWHPFADMGSVDGDRMVLTRAEGPWVWDDGGRSYLDATAALWYSNLGHGRHEIAEAVERQLKTLDAYSIFGDFANEPALELADRLAALAPTPGSRVFLGSGGGDMIETAAKVARSYHAHNGEPRRVHLIGRVGGYHGTHGVGTSVGGIAANADGLRAARRRRLQRAARRRRGARGGDPAHRRGPRRGVLLRAGDRRRRGPPPPRRLHRGGRRSLRPPRRPVRRRLRDLRVRPPGHLVRDRPLAGAPGPDRRREGPLGRHHADRGADRRPARRRAVLHRPARGAGAAPRSDLCRTPRVLRRGQRRARHLRARGADRARPDAGAAARRGARAARRAPAGGRGPRRARLPRGHRRDPRGARRRPRDRARLAARVPRGGRARPAAGAGHRGLAAAGLRPGGDRAAGGRDRRGARPRSAPLRAVAA